MTQHVSTIYMWHFSGATDCTIPYMGVVQPYLDVWRHQCRSVSGNFFVVRRMCAEFVTPLPLVRRPHMTSNSYRTVPMQCLGISEYLVTRSYRCYLCQKVISIKTSRHELLLFRFSLPSIFRHTCLMFSELLVIDRRTSTSRMLHPTHLSFMLPLTGDWRVWFMRDSGSV
jgi:hypothetical protein